MKKKSGRDLEELLNAGGQLKAGKGRGQVQSEAHDSTVLVGLRLAQNIVHLVKTNPGNPYRATVDKVCSTDRGYGVQESVGEASVILRSLLQDIGSGLLGSPLRIERGLLFRRFLRPRKRIRKRQTPKEAGVIAGVVFEDTVRRICRNEGIEKKGKKLDS